MLEERRTSDELEVGLVGCDVPPVVDVEDGRDDIGCQLASGILVDERCRQRDDDEDEDECREQAAGAAEVELAEVDLAGAVELLEDERGDEEPAEDEEDVDAEESAGDPGQVCVVEQDTDDCEGTHAIEAGEIAHFLGAGSAVELPWRGHWRSRFGHAFMLGDGAVIA